MQPPKDTKIASIVECLGDLNDIISVIEIGSQEGKFIRAILNRFKASIIAYEAHPDYCNYLQQIFSPDKVKIINYAILDIKGIANLRITDRSEKSSLYEDWVPVPSKIITVPQIPASDIITEIVDVLALNCEGSEYLILDNLINTHKILLVNKLLVQFHKRNDTDIAKIKDIYSRLETTHNLVFDIDPFKWVLWSRKQ